MIVRDVCALMEGWAPKGYAYDWDRIGLRIGKMDTPVKGIVVTLTVTPACFHFARQKKANLIIAHHAPIWNPLKKLDMSDPETRLWVEIAASGTAVFAAHTNLDVAPEGVNAVLGGLLGLVDTRPLFPVNQGRRVKLVTFVPPSHVAEVRTAMSEAGAGVIGEYSECSFRSEGIGTFVPGSKAAPYSGKRGVVNEEAEVRLEMVLPAARTEAVTEALKRAHPYEEAAFDVYPLEGSDPAIGIGVRGQLPKALSLRAFSDHVRTALEIQHVRMVGDGKQKVRTVAALGGAGGSFIERIAADVDVYVTGDVSYHEAQTALDRGLGVVDAGHHGTERWIVPYGVERLKSEVKGIAVAGYMEPDPFVAVMG